MATDGKGLNRRYCRRHVDHYKRHGSYFTRSYKIASLHPYRRYARKWLSANADDPVVREAIEAVNTRYWLAGHATEAFRLAGLSPHERSKYAWSRLRDRKVDPKDVIAAWLAIELITRDDPQSDWRREFRRVQAAKLIHRMAGGSHKRWHHESNGQSSTTELHKHPVSRGLVLRHIGEQLEKAARPVSDAHLANMQLTSKGKPR
jgi:hypothetical protein